MNLRVRFAVSLVCVVLLGYAGVADACTSRVTPLSGPRANTFTYGIVAGDFNGDGKLDLAVSIRPGLAGCGLPYSTVPCDGTAILLGNGDGTFQDFRDSSGAPIRNVPLTRQIAVGDFNGDGKPDLAGADAYMGISSQTTRHLSISLNNGDGTFKAPIDLGVESVTQIFAADMNGDGKLDLVAAVNEYFATGYQSRLLVFLGSGDGSFRTPTACPFSTTLYISVGDVNGDGKPDVLTSPFPDSSGNSSNTLYLGNGDGTLQQSLAAMPAGSGNVVIGDLNGDGIADLVMVGSLAADVYLGKGNLTFSAPTHTSPTGGGSDTSAAITDWDGDGKPDIIKTSYGYESAFFKGNGDGTFLAAKLLPGPRGGGLLIANLTPDALPDLVNWSNDRYGSSASALTNTPLRCASLVTVSSSASPNPGDRITFTTNVTPAEGSGTPTGSVTYSINSSTPATVTTPLVNGQATATIDANLLDRGQNSIGVLYSGDTIFDAFNLTPFPQTGPAVTPTVQVSVSPASPVSLQPVTVTITLTAPTSFSLAGQVYPVLIDNTELPFSMDADASGQAVEQLPGGLSPGSHLMAASYIGNAKVAPATGTAAVTVTGPAANTTTTIDACYSQGPGSQWAHCEITAQSSSSNLATGIITLSQDGAIVGSKWVPTGSGTSPQYTWNPQATIELSPHAGPHTMTAIFMSTTGFNTSTSAPVTLTVARDPTGTVLASPDASTTYTAGSPVRLHVQMTYSFFFGLPSPFAGTLAIFEGLTQVASIPITDANLQSDFSLTTLGLGTHSLTAQYSGAQDYAASTSAPLVVTVVVPPDFAMSSGGTTSATIRQGQATTVNLTLAPSGGFSGAVTFSCSGLPELASCTFNPASIPSLTASTTVAVVIRTTGPFALNRAPRRSPFSAWPGWTTVAMALGLLVTVPPTRKRKRGGLAILGLLLVAALLMISCSGGSGTQVVAPTPSTPAGTSTVTITAASGQTAHTLTLNLTVTN